MKGEHQICTVKVDRGLFSLTIRMYSETQIRRGGAYL